MDYYNRLSMIKKLLLLVFAFTVVASVAQTKLTNLPTIYISTVDGQLVMDCDTWVPATVNILSIDPTEQLNILTEIRGRGNSTWGMDKKPYRIKLALKSNLLNLPAKEKNWVLLANYADKTLLRNAVAYKISALLGFDFTPSVRFVDLVLNNEYQGCYLVTDQIEVNSKRVSINKLDSVDITEPKISGGYLLEIDGFAEGEPVWFATDKGMKITVKSPASDVIRSSQLAYIKNYISDFENRLFSADFTDPVKGYRCKVDTMSLVNWYIACELTGNPDSFWSTYIYKKRSDDKLYFGPMWDYDIAFNNDNRLGDISQKLMRQVAFDSRVWIQRLSQDKWFLNAVLQRWKTLEGNGLSAILTNYINATSAYINQSQQLNFQKWNVLNTRVYLENYLFPTYPQGVDYLKSFIDSRIAFLNSSFATIPDVLAGEPFVAKNAYYAITNLNTKNVITVSEGSVNASTPLVMWQSVISDESQLWEIRPLTDNYVSIINKKFGLAMAGNGKTNLQQVQINETDDAQKWLITAIGTDNAYGIVNKKSNYAVDNSYGSTQNGNAVIEWDNQIYQNINQQWLMEKKGTINTAGVNSQQTTLEVDLYPNPATEFVSIGFTNNHIQDFSVKVFDVAGNMKYATLERRVELGNRIVTIPLLGFAQGMYFVTVSNEKGMTTTLKFIKQQ